MKMDFSQEKAPQRKKLLMEGWNAMTVNSCEPSVSKKGNQMMIIGLMTEKKDYIETIFLVSESGKRWMLKKLLTACGIAAGQDGIYDWEPENIINKSVNVLVEHEDQEFIDRNGETKKIKQNRVVDFEPIEWDHEK